MTKSNIARQNVQDQPGTLHVGVDLALGKNVAILINEKGQRLDRFSFPQDRSGYDYFLQRLEGLRQKQRASGFVVAMEPSNYFWKLLAQELEQRRIPYRLVNAYTVKKHREGNQLDRSKDDQRDAGQIAELSRNGHYTQTRLQKGGYEELRQYATLHDQLIRAIVRKKNMLWGLAGQVFPEITQVFKDLSGETCQAFLRSFAAAASLRQLSCENFIAQVRPAYSGKKLCVSKLRQLHRLAATSIGVTEGILAIQMAIRVHLEELQTLQGQLKRVISAMKVCLVHLPESPYLLSVKSLNTVSAALFLAEIGDPCRYHSSTQLVKLAGIQPAPNTSGKKQRSKTPMSHQGRPRLRTMLYYTCLRLVHQDDHFAHLYSHLQRRPINPLTKMQALGVLMNKLLHILWALIHNHTFYNPSFGQSI